MYDNDVNLLRLNSLPPSGDFCCLLITFANRFDPVQAWEKCWPDLDPNCLTLVEFLKDFSKKLILGRKSADNNNQ